MVYLWSFVLCGALIVQGAVSDTTYFSVVGRDGHPVKEITTNQTESVVFNCTVLSGGPVSQITWKKGSHVLRESRGSLMWLNYTISKVVEENAGLYRCIVRRNGSNGFRVSKVFLHVNVPPRLTYRTSSPLFNFMGNSRTLQCYATGRPQPSFQWKFNNTLIKNSDMGNTTLLIPKEKGLELVISSFGQQHQGRFTCEASNDLGKDASDIQSIVTYRAFEVPPKIIVAKSLVRVKLNSSSELGCKADYVPFTVILDYVMLWKFNGSILSNTVKYAVANKRKLRRVGANYAKYEVHSKLRIHEVLKEDAGSYTCHVTTYLGQDEGRVILEVTRAKSEPMWAECPAGYFLNGFKINGIESLSNFEQAKCCRPQNHPNEYDGCYDEDVIVSFDEEGWSECSQAGYFMTGFYKGICSEIYCIEKFRCCKMKSASGPVFISAAVNGGWSEWGDWGECSESCGDGTQERSRSCTSPPPSAGGADCSGDDKQTKDCNLGLCSGNGGWSNWSEFGACSKTCGTGRKSRSRSCTNPPPTGEGKGCKGKYTENPKCKVRSCKGI